MLPAAALEGAAVVVQLPRRDVAVLGGRRPELVGRGGERLAECSKVLRTRARELLAELVEQARGLLLVGRVLVRALEVVEAIAARDGESPAGSLSARYRVPGGVGCRPRSGRSPEIAYQQFRLIRSSHDGAAGDMVQMVQ